MSTIVTPAEAEAEIHAIMQERIDAVRAKNGAGLVAHHAQDVVSYDLLEPLQYRGIDAVRQRGQQWFDGYDGPMAYEIVDLQIVAAFDVAFCYGLHHVSGTMRDGRKVDMYWRATQGFQRLDGDWRVVHEHGSVPFDMKTEKVFFDLKPQGATDEVRKPLAGISGGSTFGGEPIGAPA